MSQPPPPPPPPPPGPPNGGAGGPDGFRKDDKPSPEAGYHQQPTQFAGPAVPPPGQPPQPPGQAPQGQPPQPPQGQPPQAPGYGYPSPPQPPGPYGPAQPGQPVPPPFGQVPGGYQPMPPGGPGSGNRTGIVVAVVSAVVALCVLAVGAVWILSDDGGGSDPVAGGGTSQGGTGGGGEASGPQAERLFALQGPSVSDVTSVSGAWATKTVFAKSTAGGVVGVDLASGKQKWKLPLDGDICAASRQMTDDHVTAVVSEDDPNAGACSQLVLFDVDTGEKVWQKTMPGGEDAGSTSMNVTIGGGTVAVAWIGGAVGYRVSGDGVWQADPDKKCHDEGYAGGEQLVAVLECDGHSGVAVQTVDPVTGKGGPAYEVPGGVDDVAVVSTAPLVLVADSEILMVKDGDLTGRIRFGDAYEVDCRIDVIEGCHNVAAGPGGVYLRTAGHDSDSGYEDTDEIVAFDLTGKQLWKSPAGDGRQFVPLRVVDGEVIAYQLPTYDRGGAVVAIDAKSGKSHTEFTMPKDEAADSFVAFKLFDRALYAHGRFYLQKHLVGGDEKEYLAVGFGLK